MRLAIALVAVGISVALPAAAQPSEAQRNRTDPLPAEIAAQASLQTSYLLATYMTELAQAGSAPSQADVDEAARQYFTNGASVTGVPLSGPGAAYFQNGAEATAVPNSGPSAAYFHNGAEVFAFYPAPSTPSTSTGMMADAGANGAMSETSSERSTAEPAPSLNPPVPTPIIEGPPPVTPPVAASSVVTTAVGCSPRELEAAMAIAAEYAMVSASPPPTPCEVPAAPIPAPAECTPSAASAPPATQRPTSSVVSPVVSREKKGVAMKPRPSWLISALAGAVLGGLAVVLWMRPKPPRFQRPSFGRDRV